MTKYQSPYGQNYDCILYAVDLRTGWEWYGFEDEGEGIYFGYVMGFEHELGRFSIDELKQNGVPVTLDQSEIEDVLPPMGWTRIEEEVDA